jgi:hypothetical protein
MVDLNWSLFVRLVRPRILLIQILDVVPINLSGLEFVLGWYYVFLKKFCSLEHELPFRLRESRAFRRLWHFSRSGLIPEGVLYPEGHI